MKYFDQKQKYRLIIFIAILLWGVLASCSKVTPAIVDSPLTSIRVVMDNNYPPYIFLDEQGNAKGILVDQWALWEKHTGVKVELSAIPWEDALIGMKDGKFDVIDTIFYTDERAKIYNFTNSYAQINVPIFFHNNISGIAGAEDLSGFRVAVKSGDADAEYLVNAGIKNLVYYNSYEEIIQAAERNEETIFVIDEPPGLYFLYKYGLQDQFNHSAPLFSGEFHRAVKKGDPALLDLVVSGFASISESEYQTIDNRWFGIEQGNRWLEYLPYLLIGTLIVLLIIFMLIVFNRTLQKRVSQRTQELKRALSNLQKSEREYREIFNATTEAIFIHAVPGGELLHVNKSMLKMYGYESEEEVLSGDVGDLSVNEPPYTQLDAQEKMRKALEEGPQVFEWLAKKKTGESFWTEVSLRNSPIVGESQILAVVRDITERKQAEKEVQESETRYRALFEDSPVPLLEEDFSVVKRFIDTLKKNGVEDFREYFSTHSEEAKQCASMVHIVNVNKTMLEWYGIKSKTEFKVNLDQVLLSNEYESFIEELLALMQGGNRYELSVSRHARDGKFIHIIIKGTIMPGYEESWGRILVSIVDITERKQAEDALSESEKRFRSLYDNATIGMYRTTPDGQIILSNLAGIRMLGYDSFEEIAKRNLEAEEFKADYDRSQFREIIKHAGTVIGLESIWKRKDGSTIYIRESATTVKDNDGNIIYYDGTFEDITERKQAEAALRKSDQRLQVFFNQSLDGFFFCDFEEPWEWKNAKNKEEVLEYIITAQHFTDANDAMLKQYGVSREKFLSLTTSDVFAHDIEQGRKMRRELFDKGRLHLETYERTGDGTPVWFEGEYFCLYDEQERINGFFGLQRDITERKQSEEAVHQRLAEQGILHRASQSLLAVHLDPEMIYATLHQAVVQIMPCEVFNIVLDDKSGGDYHAVYLYDAGQRYPARRISRGQGLSGKVISNGETLFIHDNLQENAPAVRFGSPRAVRSILAVPLRKNNESVGMVSAQSYEPNAYGERHRVLLETLAAQITTVIENAHLFEAERKQRQMSDALRDALSAGASMSASLDFETILDHLLGTLERVVPFDGGTIMLIQPEKQKASIAKMRGYNILGRQLIDKISSFSFDIASVENLRWLINNKQPLVISDVRQYPGWVRIPESDFIRSWAGAPIIVNGEVIALFSLDSTEPNFFTNEHAELLRAFTGQASLALQNARLFDETARRALEFVSLYETSNALSAENELDGMLQVIVEHAKKLLGSASGSMYLYLSETNELELTVGTAHYTLPGMRLQLNEGLAGRVAQTHRPFRVDDYSAWEGRSMVYDGASIRAVLGVPMLYGGELIGVLTADEVGDSERKFTEADERMLSLFASQAAGAIHSARLREQTARRLNQLQSLHTIDRAISSSFDLRPILNTVISQTIAQLGVDAVDVLLFHPHLQTLEYVTGQGFRTRAIERTQLRLGEGFAGRAAFERRTIHVPDLLEAGSNFMRASILEGESFLEYYGVPLIAKGEIKGVLEVFHRASLPHNPEWLDFLETLAGQAAITIDQTQLFDDLQRANLELIIAYDATIKGWSHAMDLRDRETEGHTLRVTEMTLTLAKAMGISEKEMLHIKRGALLHDIGKMGVPDNILLKEGALTDDEWVIMRQHPIFAYKMLQPIKYLRQSLDIPYCHHEKWDGTGYPRKLQGEQIPLVARIFSVIDVWDAVTIDRPYRKAWTKQKALKYIREQSGKHFDSEVVTIFMKLFDAK